MALGLLRTGLWNYMPNPFRVKNLWKCSGNTFFHQIHPGHCNNHVVCFGCPKLSNPGLFQEGFKKSHASSLPSEDLHVIVLEKRHFSANQPGAPCQKHVFFRQVPWSHMPDLFKFLTYCLAIDMLLTVSFGCPPLKPNWTERLQEIICVKNPFQFKICMCKCSGNNFLTKSKPGLVTIIPSQCYVSLDSFLRRWIANIPRRAMFGNVPGI